MTNIMSDSAKRAASGLGASVTKSTLAITGISTKPIFTVSGGKVCITSFVGEVTTAIQAQANAAKIVATPTVGTVNDLSGTVETNGAILGSLLGLTGLAADAMVLSTGGGVSNLRNPIVVKAGTIGLNTAASSTGAITFTLTYVPIDDGATVVAA
jgi:hypothetical protein